MFLQHHHHHHHQLNISWFNWLSFSTSLSPCLFVYACSRAKLALFHSFSYWVHSIWCLFMPRTFIFFCLQCRTSFWPFDRWFSLRVFSRSFRMVVVVVTTLVLLYDVRNTDQSTWKENGSSGSSNNVWCRFRYKSIVCERFFFYFSVRPNHTAHTHSGHWLLSFSFISSRLSASRVQLNLILYWVKIFEIKSLTNELTKKQQRRLRRQPFSIHRLTVCLCIQTITVWLIADFIECEFVWVCVCVCVLSVPAVQINNRQQKKEK